MEYYAKLLSLKSESLFPSASWITLGLGVAHCYQIMKMLIYSLRAKRLCFGSMVRKRGVFHVCGSKNLSILNRVPRLYTCGPRVRSIFLRLYGRQGVFGVESSYFEARYLIREFGEMVSQTIQAYSSSMLIGRMWINRLYVAIVFLNACSTPLAQRLTRHSPALERVSCLAFDLALDIVMSIALPLIIVFPYYQVFNVAELSFDPKLLIDVLWFVNMVMENRQVFAQNEVDLALKLLPHVSIFSCLGSIQSLIRLRRGRQKQFAQSPLMPNPPETVLLAQASNPKPIRCASSQPPSRGSSIFRQLSLRIRQMQSRRLQPHRSKMIHTFFILWGVLVVLLHLLALLPSQGVTMSGCKLQIHPWLTAMHACAVYEFNCYRHGLLSPDKSSLSLLDERSLAILVFSHCPELNVPSSIQNFRMLTGVEIWNSSIVSWTKDAGIKEDVHVQIVYVSLVKVNMTSVPDGLLYDLPRDLQDIEIIHSNLTSLPEDMDTRWRHLKTLYLEHLQLKEVPSALAKMDIDELSLIGNQITQLPFGFADRNPRRGGFLTLSLSNNPLRELPKDIGNASKLFILSFENTELEELPIWVYQVQHQAFKIYMHGTPFCRSKSVAEMDSKYGISAVLTCARTNPWIDGWYPYDAVQSTQIP